METFLSRGWCSLNWSVWVPFETPTLGAYTAVLGYTGSKYQVSLPLPIKGKRVETSGSGWVT